MLADAVDGFVALQGGCAHIEDLLQGGRFLPWHRLLLILRMVIMPLDSLPSTEFVQLEVSPPLAPPAAHSAGALILPVSLSGFLCLIFHVSREYSSIPSNCICNPRSCCSRNMRIHTMACLYLWASFVVGDALMATIQVLLDQLHIEGMICAILCYLRPFINLRTSFKACDMPAVVPTQRTAKASDNHRSRV